MLDLSTYGANCLTTLFTYLNRVSTYGINCLLNLSTYGTNCILNIYLPIEQIVYLTSIYQWNQLFT